VPAHIEASEGRALFGLDPDNYDAIRPPYPEPIFDLLQATKRPGKSSSSSRITGPPCVAQSPTLGIAARLQDIAATRRFDPAKHLLHTWTLELTTKQVGALYGTFSNINCLPGDARSRILDQLMEIAERDLGGRVERNMLSPVYVARRQ